MVLNLDALIDDQEKNVTVELVLFYRFFIDKITLSLPIHLEP